ncbi:MAG: hypothetical protein JF888_08305 [Candidatus Dormibacteraeota bacterium]|uniref:Uncharacterized protein n=1 Tax=Candidatus Dormiibacter inghamiae TaxID=3127013 RepID=A0A934KI83_9BACT|nr:hypothetical protein [Candidatus Dormibacteraeota bacterium]MBJ7607626.1 hypothetical protein [Candidatus Dormibacteraeota bacterium]
MSWPRILLPLLLTPLALGLLGGALKWPGVRSLRLLSLWPYGSGVLSLGHLFPFAGAMDGRDCGPSNDCEHGLAVGWMLFSVAASSALALGLVVYPSLGWLLDSRRSR